MSEPFMPVPGPEENSSWEWTPARCSECGEIIDARPTSQGAEGWCQFHGVVPAVYGNGTQVPEYPDEKEEA